MDASQFAEFWRRQGYRVVETKSCFWYNPYHRFGFLSIPYHRLIDPSEVECANVFVSGPAVMLGYSTLAKGDNGDSWLFVCPDKNYAFHSLEKKARNQTRRGIENCKIEQIDFGYLAKAGQVLNEQTLNRQRRNSRDVTGERWIRYCTAASGIGDFQAWGAFVEGELASCMVTALIEDCLSILHQSSLDESLKHYSNNALIFTVTKLKLACPEINIVSYGLRGLENSTGLDHFKFSMGFGKRPFHRRLVINPVLRPMLALGGRKLISTVAQKSAEKSFWRYVAGVLERV